MTQKANPSINRPAEAFKTAGAIAHGGAQDGYVVDGTSPTQIAVQDGGIDEGDLNSFAESHSASSYDVTIDPGEAFVFGTWLAKDAPTTVTLTASTTGQTVYVGWNKNGSDDVIIGTSGDFEAADGNTDQKIPLWDFDTDSSGVTAATDRRLLGRPVDVSQNDVTISVGNESLTVNKDGPIEVNGAALDVNANNINNFWHLNGDPSKGIHRIHTGTGDGSGSVSIRDTSTSTDILQANEGGPVEINTQLAQNDYIRLDGGDQWITNHDGHGNFNLKSGIDDNHNIVAGSGGSHIKLNENGGIYLQIDENTSEGNSANTNRVASFSETKVIFGGADAMGLPKVSSDPSATVGEMWYRTDLD